jgi:hypothetical protein
MSNSIQLTPTSIVGVLPLHDFQVQAQTLGHVVAERFEREPTLPGVIVLNGTQPLGVISRPAFLANLGLLYDADGYLNRPIQVLLNWLNAQILILADTCLIQEAAESVLSRSQSVVYDPVVIAFQDGSLRLLEVHWLLLAQSRILARVNKTVEQQKRQIQAGQEQLRQLQMQAQQFDQVLAGQLRAAQACSQDLEKHHTQLSQQSEAVQQLNQRCLQFGELLSTESKKAFQTTIETVYILSGHVDGLIEVAQALMKELEVVRGAAGLMRQMSKQARFLGLRTAILSHQFDTEVDNGLTQVTSDIERLSLKTLEASDQMVETSDRLKLRVTELGQLAQREATVAQTLIHKVSHIETVLIELENLLRSESDGVNNETKTSAAELTAVRSLKQSVESAIESLKMLDSVLYRRKSPDLVRKIERKLEQSKNVIPSEIAAKYVRSRR